MRAAENEIAEIDAELRRIDIALAERDLDDEDDPRFVELVERKVQLEHRRELLVPVTIASVRPR
jgi:hypothetical protein